MRFFFNTPAYKPAYRFGGPIHSVAALAEGLVKRGHFVRVASSNLDVTEKFDIELGVDHDIEGVQVRYFDAQKTLLQKTGIPYFSKAAVCRLGPEFREWLHSVGPSTDVFHSQISYQTNSLMVARYAKEHGKVYFYHQRGNLDPVRLQSGKWKKSLYIWLKERPTLLLADALLALTPHEMESYRRFAPNARIELSPNGIDAGFAARGSRNLSGPIAALLNRITDEPVLLFMSRLHGLKGPDIFVDAAIGALKNGARFHAIVAGPDEKQMEDALRSKVQDAGLTERVHFTGAISGDNKLAVLKRADLFVLPTLSEGFSMVILEALSCGCAVLTTPGAYFEEIETAGAGKIVDRTVEEFSKAMADFVAAGRSSMQELGKRGQTLVAEKYTWDSVIDRYVELASELVAKKKFDSK